MTQAKQIIDDRSKHAAHVCQDRPRARTLVYTQTIKAIRLYLLFTGPTMNRSL
jgi:hypothetical protein